MTGKEVVSDEGIHLQLESACSSSTVVLFLLAMNWEDISQEGHRIQGLSNYHVCELYLLSFDTQHRWLLPIVNWTSDSRGLLTKIMVKRDTFFIPWLHCDSHLL